MPHQLSEAELRQRRDAARARWAAVAGAALGGGLGTRAAISQLAAKRWAELRALHQGTVAPAEQAHEQKMARLGRNERYWREHVRTHWPIPAARAYWQQQKRNAEGFFRTAADIWARLANEPETSDEEWNRFAVANEHHTAMLHEANEQLGWMQDAKPPGKSRSRARTGRTYTLSAHTRMKKVPVKHDPDSPEGKFVRELGEWQARESEVKRLYGEYEKAGGPKAPPEYYARYAEALKGLGHKPLQPPGLKIKTTETKLVEVRPDPAKVHKTRAHKLKRAPGEEGTHSRAEIAQLRSDLLSEISNHASDRKLDELNRHVRVLRDARARFRAAAAPILRWLPRTRVKIGGTFAGAAGGALLALAAAHAIDRINRRHLAKADDDPDKDASDQLNDLAGDAEKKVAENLGRTFVSWKDKPLSELAAAVPAGLNEATAPLADVMRGASQVPVQGLTEEGVGEPRVIAFSMEHRSPLPEDYVSQYRQNRIVELTTEQLSAIHDILVRGTQEGTSPDEIARAVRRNIGLTSTQMSHVENYRRELLDNDYGALERGLRDKRFDGLVQRTFDQNGKLSIDQVDRLVDAYHRKYLAYRAMTIARTEGVGFANNGHILAVRAMLLQNPGFTVIKTWNAKRDQHTRPDHYAMHNTQVIGLETQFEAPSGDQIRWPHDQTAKARQVCNCRCTISCRLVPRALAAALGTASVQPFKETQNAA
jgi:hypothetical protein